MTRVFSQHKDWPARSRIPSRAVPCRPVSATKRGSPIATRDASYLQRSELLHFFRDERSEHAFHSGRRCRRVESSRVDSTRLASRARYLRSRACARERPAARNVTRHMQAFVYTRAYIGTCVGTYLLLAPCSSMVASCAFCHVQRDQRWPMRVDAQCSSIFGATMHRSRRAFRNGANVAANEPVALARYQFRTRKCRALDSSITVDAACGVAHHRLSREMIPWAHSHLHFSSH